MSLTRNEIAEFQDRITELQDKIFGVSDELDEFLNDHENVDLAKGELDTAESAMSAAFSLLQQISANASTVTRLLRALADHSLQLANTISDSGAISIPDDVVIAIRLLPDKAENICKIIGRK